MSERRKIWQAELKQFSIVQKEIGQIQELLDRRVDLVARIQCLHHLGKDHLIESGQLSDVMDRLYELTKNEIYKI